MGIYPDKKDGKLTGRWRVELQRGAQRYRKRWDSHAEAVKDEEAVLADWEAGNGPPAPGKAAGAPEVHTLGDTVAKAQGNLWAGKSTEASCYAHLQTISKILGPAKRLDDIDTLGVDELIRKLQKSGLSEATINRYLSHLRTFLAWAKDRKYRKVPLEEIAFAWRKESQGRIRWITVEEQQALKEYMLSPTSLKRHPDYADIWSLVEIAIATGCRRDELRTAEADQVNGHLLHLWKTKTDSPRTVPMSPEIAGKLRDLLERKAMPTVTVLMKRWNAARVALGLKDDATFVFHACRHTCATRMVDAGVNVFVIKEWMGHKKIETTLRYAHVKPQNLEDALLRVGEWDKPRSQKPSNSAENTIPLSYPTGGVNPNFSAAA